MVKFWGSTEKVEYRCTTTILPLCNDAITVLKITLLHSVSVITNFVIPKGWQTDKNKKKHQTFWATAGGRPTIHTILGIVIKEVRPIYAPPNFFDPILSFAARAIENLRENAPTVGKCLYLGCLSPESDKTKNLKATYRRIQTLRIS